MIKVVKVSHIQRNGSFVHVADVEVAETASVTDALEQAYSRTQNYEGSWSRGPKFEGDERNPDFSPLVTVRAPLHEEGGRVYGLRSSMMEDRFELDGVTYVCASIGFTTLDGKRVRS